MADTNTDADTDVRPKRRLGVVLVVASLLVLGLALVGLGKSNNFETFETLDYFVCTGTIDGRTLLAELNFQKNKDVLALIVFPDGRHWSLAGRRFEHGQHSWNLLDPDSNVAGQLIGEWDSKTGKFSGRLIATDSKEKPAVVELQRVAQFVRHVSGQGLRIGSFGSRFVFDAMQPRFDERSDDGEIRHGAILNQKLEHFLESEIETPSSPLTLGDCLAVCRDSLTRSDDRLFEGSTHILAMRDGIVSVRHYWPLGGCTGNPVELPQSSTIYSLDFNDGKAKEISSYDFFLNDDQRRQELMSLVAKFATRERLKKFRREDDSSRSIESVDSKRLSYTDFSIEPAGTRFLVSSGIPLPYIGLPMHGWPQDEIEVLIPWSELRPYLNLDGPVRRWLPHEEVTDER